MTEKIQERAIEAAAKFVDRRGYEVLDKAWSAKEGISVDLVARDGDTIVFIDVAGREGIEKGLPEEDPAGCRQRMEIAAARWLAEHAEEFADVAIRFDLIVLMVIDESRALLRHHINALGCGEFAALTEEVENELV